MALILALAALLDGFGLWRGGYPNPYYAVSARSMMASWHNFLFVAFDPVGFLSIDKPPLGLWIQVASAKAFGFHPWSLLLPQALAGIAAVYVLYRLVARSFGRPAALPAALALALTPISVAAARNNTMDSVLALAMLLAVWAALRAIESGQLRWLLVCAAVLGLAFNVKTLEAFLVLPAIVLAYLVAARGSVRRRLASLALAVLALGVVSLPWVLAVDAVPRAERPYI
ncbi:MAG: glycosyltransferase family 39 protein, partial [Chloroflexota bacterium]